MKRLKIPTVVFRNKKDIEPYFGMAYSTHIEIRNDLPDIVQKFLILHETYHYHDKSTNPLWRELKANCYGFLITPFGFILTLFLSLTPARLKLYINRIKRKE